MLKKLVNYLRGSIRVAVTGPYPERVLNLCAQHGVEFWAVDWQEPFRFTMTLRWLGLEEAARLSRKANCELEVLERVGFPLLLRRFRRRYSFLIGLTLALCAVTFLSQFVLTIQITGCQRVPESAVLQQLQRFGVHPGAFGPSLDRRQIEQEILLALPELSWMTVNLHGTLVDVHVREVEPVPERVDESGHYHVVSRAGGIITHIEPELGDALVGDGDTVSPGDILISSTVTLEPPLYSDKPNRYYQVHARGQVWARTWRTLNAVIPLETAGKAYTGKEHSRWSINFFGKSVEIFGKSSIPGGSYDKITSVRQAALPGGELLPLWLRREVWREYQPTTLTVDRDGADDLLRQELGRQLEKLVGDQGQVLDVEYTTRVADGLLHVTAVGECLEEIGQERPAHEITP